MGIIAKKGLGTAYNWAKKNIHSKMAKSSKKTDAEEHFDTAYKLDKTGKKDKAISSMNKFLKEKKRSASPGMVDRYHEIMTGDSKYTKKYWKKKEGKK